MTESMAKVLATRRRGMTHVCGELAGVFTGEPCMERRRRSQSALRTSGEHQEVGRSVDAVCRSLYQLLRRLLHDCVCNGAAKAKGADPREPLALDAHPRNSLGRKAERLPFGGDSRVDLMQVQPGRQLV